MNFIRDYGALLVQIAGLLILLIIYKIPEVFCWWFDIFLWSGFVLFILGFYLRWRDVKRGGSEEHREVLARVYENFGIALAAGGVVALYTVPGAPLWIIGTLFFGGLAIMMFGIKTDPRYDKRI